MRFLSRSREGVVICIRCRREIVQERGFFLCGCGPSFVTEPIHGSPYHLPLNPKDAA